MQKRKVVSYDSLHLEKNLIFNNVIILIIVLIVLIVFNKDKNNCYDNIFLR